MLEGDNFTALRIDAGHDVLDGAVLAGGVHRLEHEQDRIGVRGIKLVLRGGQGGEVLGELVLGEFLPLSLRNLLVAGPGCVVVLEAELLARCHADGIDEFLQGRHRRSLLAVSI